MSSSPTRRVHATHSGWSSTSSAADFESKNSILNKRKSVGSYIPTSTCDSSHSDRGEHKRAKVSFTLSRGCSAPSLGSSSTSPHAVPPKKHVRPKSAAEKAIAAGKKLAKSSGKLGHSHGSRLVDRTLSSIGPQYNRLGVRQNSSGPLLPNGRFRSKDAVLDSSSSSSPCIRAPLQSSARSESKTSIHTSNPPSVLKTNDTATFSNESRVRSDKEKKNLYSKTVNFCSPNHHERQSFRTPKASPSGSTGFGIQRNHLKLKQGAQYVDRSQHSSTHQRRTNMAVSDDESSGDHSPLERSALSKLLDEEDQEVASDAAGASATDDPAEVFDSLRAVESDAPPGVCVECEESPAVVACKQCGDDVYCDMCYTMLHRKGKRVQHTPVGRSTEDIKAAAQLLAEMGKQQSSARASSTAIGSSKTAHVNSILGVGSAHKRLSPEWFAERTRFIPIRLDLEQRKRLRLFVASLSVTDYTGRVDRPNLLRGAKRMHQQLKEMCSIFSGLVLASDRTAGQELLKNRDFKTCEPFFKKGFEITRRHKIMNPEKLRTNYGKMVYLLQDASAEEANTMLQFSLASSINTVYAYLEKKSILELLQEPDLAIATMEILPDKKSRGQIQSEIKAKERARERIARKYASGNNKEAILWCLYSIGDNFSFVNSNRNPIDAMIKFLKEYFSPGKVDKEFSLAIAEGVDGARLTHNHARHYNYVLQSLTLWREIADDMFRLWSLAEQDLLDAGNKYVMKDTGQGLQRVQAAPRVLQAMRTILHNCQQNLGEWIGSSVIHLGDDNVPNAMMFVDKYTQVAKILSPIIQTIKEIDDLVKDPGLKLYVKKGFGGPEMLKKQILYDFFKNAFDGSGADNFFDAGSCIDGRLTSAWNWCSTLPEKPFYNVFLLCGFVGFDGEFQE
eukprot:m.882803 g.882803  ORF g.882803 m.882803 type:complete len:901 (+) comp23598_c0_seq3:82-2784(+)